ncbi:hypothetical protein X777_12236 [Ooceraea biroi]|uniref:Uncharacterized protein n=1 Tax=Ooceraea biroi TaxID=2015173 RepID=A0A026W0C1_OOCBI|nr:hypothetical protein X777_12236 [Ooceraea biroi]
MLIIIWVFVCGTDSSDVCGTEFSLNIEHKDFDSFCTIISTKSKILHDFLIRKSIAPFVFICCLILFLV